MRRSALPSRPWARVTGRSRVISVTREDRVSTSWRKCSLWVRSRARRRATSSEAAGTTTRKTGRNSGVRTAMMTRPPVSTVKAPSPVSAVCCTICSTVSTSRATLACRTPALTREW